VNETNNKFARVLNLNAAVYTLDAIKKAARKLRGHLCVLVEHHGYMNIVRLMPVADCSSFDGLVRAFCNEVADQELRQRVLREMAEVRNLLLGRANSSAALSKCA
jgi:His-Xaa-Ser system protein HxsD